jgi:outer membrane protein assembly factor BamB
LFLIGGGALLLLLILLVVLLWAVRRQGADQLLALAEEDYKMGSYTQAIAKFTEFLERFPRHPRAGMVRVHRGLARLRQAVEASSDWPGTLRVAQEVLTEISGEETFKDEARGELAALLPRIAEELARRAYDQLDIQMLSAAEEALTLVNRYVPPGDRPVSLVAEIESRMALTRHRLAAGDRLRQTLEEIRRAIVSNQPAKAHELRRQLLRDYPHLAEDPGLMQASREATAAERALVEVAESSLSVTAEDWPARPRPMLLACRSTAQPAVGAEGQVVCTLHQGVAFGLDAVTGQLLWHRVVGEHLTGRGVPSVPILVGTAREPEFVLVDIVHKELLRLAGRTGAIRWRLGLEEPPAADPVVLGESLWIAFRSGKLLEVEQATGEAKREIRFPQALRVSPAADARRRYLFQPGEHSTLFVLDRVSGSCVQTLYVGHEPGSLSLPPVVLASYGVLTVASGVNQTDLYVFEIREEQAEEPVVLVQQIRLPGQVTVPPAVSGTRLLVASQSGSAWVYELAPGDPKKPLREIAQGNLGPAERTLGPAGKELVPRFAQFQGAQVWVADYQLSCYDVLPLKGALQPKTIRNEASYSVQPLVTIDRYIYHIRKVSGLPDLVVNSFRMEDTQPCWETRLAVPLVTEPLASSDGQSLICVTQTGSLYRLTLSEVQPGSIRDEPYITLRLAELQEPLQDAIGLSEGQVVLVPPIGSRRLPMYDPAEPAARFRWLLLSDGLGGKLAGFGVGVLVGLQSGQLWWIHPRDGKPLAEPFQLPEISAQPVQWLKPWVLSEREVIVAEKSGRIYRLALHSDPKPHWQVKSQVRWENGFDTELAVSGKLLWGASKEGILVGFALPDLQAESQLELGETILWGPWELGDKLLVATSTELVACGANGKQLWRQAPEHALPVGKPLQDDGRILLTTRDGWLLAIDPATGKTIGSRHLETDLATGPIRVGARILVGGRDGGLYLTDVPE